MFQPERIRRGGRPGPDGYLFEITGGALCLDLANTVDSRPTKEPRELLRDYSDLVSWALQAGAISSEEASRLKAAAQGQREEARRALERIRILREELFSVFAAVALKRGLEGHDLATLNAHVSDALSHLRLAAVGPRVEWQWAREEVSPLDIVRWRVARSAAELLTSPLVGRVRRCEGTGCAWLFMDGSRNGSRRWCDMTVCGNRVKARRFRQRARRRLA